MGHRIGMVTTGGTISMRREAEGKAPTPALGGAQLVSMLDEGAHVADVEVTMYEPHRIASEDLSFSLLSNLVLTVEQALAENDSVIVTHGTDTMEDAAFFVAEAICAEQFELACLQNFGGVGWPVQFGLASFFVFAMPAFPATHKAE